MTLKIVKADEPMEVKQIVMTVYGQPGAGKTSLSFSAASPLLLDFDKGAYRAANRKDAVEIETWGEIASLKESDLKPYDTVIVDTVGRALDCLTAQIIKDNPKLARGSGALTLQGYGELKASFTAWIKMLREQGKDVILIAHDAEDKNGDETIVRPDVQGGSRQEIIKVADCMGYLYVGKKDVRVLDFNPSDKWVGKNCAALDPILVPQLAEEPAFMGGVIQKIKDSLNELTEAQKEVAQVMATWKETTDAAETEKDLNSLVKASQEMPENVQANVKRLIMQRAKALGATFNKETEQFEIPVAEEPAEATA